MKIRTGRKESQSNMPPMNQSDLRRAMEDLNAAKAAGFTPKQTVYPIGTPVVNVGAENFKISRNEWDDLPMPYEALESLKEKIVAENRKDTLIFAKDLAVNEGLVTLKDGTHKQYPISQRAFNDLMAWITKSHDVGGAPSYLSAIPQAMREEHANYWLGKAYKIDARATKKDGQNTYKPIALKLRTRDNEGIFGITGPRHTSYDLDRIASQLQDKLAGGDARCSVMYNGYKATIDVLYHSDIVPQDAVAGEFFKAGLRIQADDAGHGSIKVVALLWRNLCRNLIVVDFNKLVVGSRRHQGEIKDIARDLDEYIQAANSKLEHFINRWGESARENVLKKYDLQDIDEVFAGLIHNKLVYVPGIRPDEMLNRLHRAWEMEPGYSKTSVLNAITRAAHSESWKSYENIEDLESTAGELLFQKVWRVDIPESELDVL